MKPLFPPPGAGGGAGGDLDRCRRLLSLIASSSSEVACFRCRWNSLASLAARLSVVLDDVFSLASAGEARKSNSLAVDLLASLSSALDTAVALAGECRSAEPPRGKLVTQSDLAAVVATLEQLAADADLLLSPPSVSALSDVVTRLRVGTAASRSSALDALLEAIASDPDAALSTAKAGAVGAVVPLLAAQSGDTRVKASSAIAAFALCGAVDASASGAVLGHLVRLLESDNAAAAAAEKACVAMQELTLTRDNSVIVASRGGVSVLLDVCRDGSPAAQGAAAGVLKNLASFPILRSNFIDDGAIPVLIQLGVLGTPLARANAVACLRNLTADDGEDDGAVKISVFQDGALDCIKNYLESGQTAEPAIGLLSNLSSFRYIAEIIASSGFLLHILAALESSCPNVRAEAAKVIAGLQVTGKAKKDIGDAMPRLVKMLETKNRHEKEAAAMALAALVSCPDYRKLFKKDERGIVNVVQLLDPHVGIANKRHAVFILLSISKSRRCRRQMVAAGACGFLQGLLTLEVDGAKKLLECLGKGKVLGVFPRV